MSVEVVTMQRTSLILATAALLLTGCASRTRSLAAVDSQGDLSRAAGFVLESSDGQEGMITVTAKSERDLEFEGRTLDVARFRFAIDNTSDDPLELPLGSMRCVDDAGRQLGLLTAYLPPEADVDRFQVPPKTKTSVEVLFEVGGPESLQSVGSVTLDWNYAFRGQSIPHQTRFLPVRYVSRPVYYPYGGVGFGFNYWGRRSFYGGWYGPGPWGPAWCW